MSHLYRSVIFLSCQFSFSFSGSHLYRSTIFLLVWFWVFELGIAPISIGHFRVSLSFWGRTYIDRSSHCLVSSVWVEFLGPHLYQSVIYLVSFCLVRFGTAPISIGHSCYLVSSAWFSRPHLYWSIVVLSVWIWVFWGHTYIDRPSSY